MENYEQMMADIQRTTDQITALQETLRSQFANAVEEVMAGRLADEKQIDRLNADLIDLGDDIRFYELSKRLWAAIYRNHPQLIQKGFKGMYRWADAELQKEEKT